MCILALAFASSDSSIIMHERLNPFDDTLLPVLSEHRRTQNEY